MKRGQLQKLKGQAAILRAKLAKKRRGDVVDEAAAAPETKYLSVALCAQEPSGPAQKYTRLTALETVETTDISLEGIKEACSKHFKEERECVVMVSDKGPSVRHISQLKLSKSFCCRFVEGPLATTSNQQQVVVPEARRFNSERPHSSQRSLPRMFSSVTSLPRTSVPVSLSMAGLLQMGKAIQPDRDMITLHVEEFNVLRKSWHAPIIAKFVVDREAFATGGFRHAYRAKQVGTGLGGERQFVLKRYKDSSIEHINIVMKENVVEATRKNVQMHMIARNLASLLQMDAPEGYGEHIAFNKAYYAQNPSGDPVFLEPYMEGEFIKHINNDGKTFECEDRQLGEKVQAYVHFTYVKCKEVCMVVDIQGCGYNLTDPEITTKEKRDVNDAWVFCAGNMNKTAITNFFIEHACNEYCEKLGLNSA